MKKQEKKTPLLDLEALYFILVMSIYETYCWQIYRLDQTRLGPVKEHRVFNYSLLTRVVTGSISAYTFVTNANATKDVKI